MSKEEKKELAEILLDFGNALESAAVNLKRYVADLLNESADAKPNWNPEKIAWTNNDGPSGPYQKSTDINNPEFKLMVEDLKLHKNRMRKGDYFYWLFTQTETPTVGRKPIKKTVSQ